MRASLEYAIKMFGEFNRTMFDNALPPLPIQLSNAGRSLGMFVHPRQRPQAGSPDTSGCSLRISTRLDLPEVDVENTIIHEMIHYYIWYFNIPDSSPHGPAFRRKMEEINRRHNRCISIRHKSSEEQLQSDTHHRNNYICVQYHTDGRRTLTVCSRPFIFDLHRILKDNPRFCRVEWYWSMDSWFNRFPLSRSAKMYLLSDADFNAHFATATPCECDGLTFNPRPRLRRCPPPPAKCGIPALASHEKDWQGWGNT